jgi:hypothetical protein
MLLHVILLREVKQDRGRMLLAKQTLARELMLAQILALAPMLNQKAMEEPQLGRILTAMACRMIKIFVLLAMTMIILTVMVCPERAIHALIHRHYLAVLLRKITTATALERAAIWMIRRSLALIPQTAMLI